MKTAQRSFSAGEITPELFGQIADPLYQLAVSECTNLIPLPHGPVMLRPGLRESAPIEDVYGDVALIPFVASDTEAFLVVAQVGRLAVYALNGVRVATWAVADLTEDQRVRLHWAQSFDVLTITAPGMIPVRISRSGLSWSMINDPIEPVDVSGYTGYSIGLSVPAAGANPQDFSYIITQSMLQSIGSGDNRDGGVKVTHSGVISVDPAAGTVRLTVGPNSPAAYDVRLYVYRDGAWVLVFSVDTNAVWHTLSHNYDFVMNIAEPFAAFDPLTNPVLKSHHPVGDFTPRAVTYHQQRLFFGGFPLLEDTFIGSRPANYYDFTWGLPYVATDALSFQLATLQYNQIEHLVSLSDLIILTNSTVFSATGGEAAINPSNIGVRARSSVGASPTQPAVTQDSLVFSSNRGAHLHEVRYSYEQGGHVVNDISQLAPHLVEGRTVVSLAMQESPFPVLWVVLDNGTLLSCTYVPRSKVLAWARHELAKIDGEAPRVTSVAVTPDTIEDRVTLAITFPSGGMGLYRFDSFLDQSRNGLRLDYAKVLTVGSEGNTTFNVGSEEGKVIIADGAVIEDPDFSIPGWIRLPEPADLVIAGWPYQGRLKSMPLNTESRTTRGEGSMRNVSQVHLRVHSAVIPKAGPSFDNLVEFPPRENEDLGLPPEQRTELVSVSVPPDWVEDPVVCLLFDEPFPARVLSMGTDTEVGA